MGLIREPLDVDFTVVPNQLTKAEKIAISEYIRDYKIKETAKTPLERGNKKKAARQKDSATH